MSTLYMIRHGQGSFGKRNYDVLSDKGVAQSKLLADYLYRTDVQFDYVYTGTLDRQKSTAHVILEMYKQNKISVPDQEVVQDFDEYDSETIIKAIIPVMIKEDPSLQKDVSQIFSDSSSFKKVFEKAMIMWAEGKVTCDDIVSYEDFKSNVVGALRSVIAKTGSGKTIAIFTSGGVISSVVGWVLGTSNKTIMNLNWQIVNSSYTIFKFRDDSIMLSSFNCYTHLNLKKDDDLITYK